jgi:hypothetical protein
MKTINLTQSISTLKKRAKELQKKSDIKLTQAQNEIARTQGYDTWSLLMSKFHQESIDSVDVLWHALFPNRVTMLVAAENVGKVTLAINLALKAINENKKVCYFSLSTPKSLILSRFEKIGGNPSGLIIDDSPSLLIQNLDKDMDLVIIDHLQDVSGVNDSFMLSIKRFARENQTSILLLNQVEPIHSRHCDLVMCLTRDSEYAELELEKTPVVSGDKLSLSYNDGVFSVGVNHGHISKIAEISS